MLNRIKAISLLSFSVISMRQLLIEMKNDTSNQMIWNQSIALISCHLVINVSICVKVTLAEFGEKPIARNRKLILSGNILQFRKPIRKIVKFKSIYDGW